MGKIPCMTEKKDDSAFKKQLDDHYQWPSKYLFKFIVPSGNENQFKEILPGEELRFRSSKGGKYTSISAEVVMNSSEEVMDIYRKAYLIEGVISL